MASRYVPDTNILSYVLQRRQVTIDRFAAAAKTDAEIFLCPVVYYEIRRGLLDKGVARQIADFDRLTADLIWVDVARPMWEDAANSWATRD